MKAKTPTKKQAAILKFIEEYTEEHDMSPSYREIMAALRLRSVSAVAEHINNCVAAGFLEKLPNQARTLRIIPVETHEETVKFFNQRLAELDQELAQIEDRIAASSNFQLSLGDENAPEASKNTLVASDAQKTISALMRESEAIEEQISTLRRAADILEIDL